jgi:hypothetical protein
MAEEQLPCVPSCWRATCPGRSRPCTRHAWPRHHRPRPRLASLGREPSGMPHPMPARALAGLATVTPWSHRALAAPGFSITGPATPVPHARMRSTGLAAAAPRSCPALVAPGCAIAGPALASPGCEPSGRLHPMPACTPASLWQPRPGRALAWSRITGHDDFANCSQVRAVECLLRLLLATLSNGVALQVTGNGNQKT